MRIKRKTLQKVRRKKATAKTPRKRRVDLCVENDDVIRDLRARSHSVSTVGQSGIAGAIQLRKGLLLTLALGKGDADKKAYKRLVASATYEPSSSAPVLGRCCAKRHKRK